MSGSWREDPSSSPITVDDLIAARRVLNRPMPSSRVIVSPWVMHEWWYALDSALARTQWSRVRPFPRWDRLAARLRRARSRLRRRLRRDET